jgi:thioredoxin reductase (NADPH)
MFLNCKGFELMENMKNQSLRFGTRIFSETVTEINLAERPFVVKTDSRTMQAHAVIIATGATAKRMPIPGAGDDELWQKGISACAVCDGAVPMFRNKPLAVIGGGDSAIEEATFLTKYGSKVYIIHRRDELRASKIMAARARANPKIEFLYSHVVLEAIGKNTLEKILVQNLKTNEKSELPVAGLFFAIGHEPNTKFLNNQLKLDEQQYIITEKGTTKTSVKGVFAAGDVQDKRYRQAVTAAGTGCMAALEVEHYLNENGL